MVKFNKHNILATKVYTILMNLRTWEKSTVFTMCLCERLNSSSPLTAFQILLKEIVAQLMALSSTLPTLFQIICLGSFIPVSHSQGTCSYKIVCHAWGKTWIWKNLGIYRVILVWVLANKFQGGKTLAWRRGGS